MENFLTSNLLFFFFLERKITAGFSGKNGLRARKVKSWPKARVNHDLDYRGGNGKCEKNDRFLE